MTQVSQDFFEQASSLHTLRIEHYIWGSGSESSRSISLVVPYHLANACIAETEREKKRQITRRCYYKKCLLYVQPFHKVPGPTALNENMVTIIRRRF